MTARHNACLRLTPITLRAANAFIARRTPRSARRRPMSAKGDFLSCSRAVPVLVPHGDGARYRESLVLDSAFALFRCGDISMSIGVSR